MNLQKGLSILVALASTAAFGFASIAAPRTITPLDLLHPGMNFAFVRVAGAVVTAPQVFEREGYLTFVMQDQAGRIRVTAYRQAVRAMLAANRVPQAGDQVRVDGTLRIRDDEPVLVLNAETDLELVRPAATDLALSAIDAARVGDRVAAVGQLRHVRAPREGSWLLTLRDGSTTLDVPLQAATLALTPCGWLRVTGGVGEYRDAKQLLPADDAAVQVAPAQPLDVRPISALNPELLGAWVTVRAEVVELRPFKLGMRLDLQDADGSQIDGVLFDRIWQTLPFSTTLQPGDTVQLSGVLGEFHGNLQIVPELSCDVARQL